MLHALMLAVGDSGNAPPVEKSRFASSASFVADVTGDGRPEILITDAARNGAVVVASDGRRRVVPITPEFRIADGCVAADAATPTPTESTRFYLSLTAKEPTPKGSGAVAVYELSRRDLSISAVDCIPTTGSNGGAAASVTTLTFGNRAYLAIGDIGKRLADRRVGTVSLHDASTLALVTETWGRSGNSIGYGILGWTDAKDAVLVTSHPETAFVVNVATCSDGLVQFRAAPPQPTKPPPYERGMCRVLLPQPDGELWGAVAVEGASDEGSGVEDRPDLLRIFNVRTRALLLEVVDPGWKDRGDYVIETSVTYTMIHNSGLSRFGESACTVGDLDGDGFRELAVGAPCFGTLSEDTNMFHGAVYIFSGRTFEVIRRITGNVGDELGTGLTSGYDYDGDGKQDLLALGCAEHATRKGGVAKVIAAATGKVLTEIRRTD